MGEEQVRGGGEGDWSGGAGLGGARGVREVRGGGRGDGETEQGERVGGGRVGHGWCRLTMLVCGESRWFRRRELAASGIASGGGLASEWGRAALATTVL